MTDEEARRYVVVIEQPDGKIYPLQYHSIESEARHTASNHNRSGSTKRAVVRSDGNAVWAKCGWEIGDPP